jgi:hypothetical protein
MGIINLIICILLFIILLFILTRRLPPLVIIPSCSSDADCGDAGQCQTSVCVSNQLITQLLLAQNSANAAYNAINDLYNQLDLNKLQYASDNYENFMKSVSKAGTAVESYKNAAALANYVGKNGNSGADGFISLSMLITAINLAGSIGLYADTLPSTFAALNTNIPSTYVEDAVSAISVAAADANNLYLLVFL